MTTMKSAPGSRLPVRKPPPAMSAERGTSAPSKLEELRKQYQQQIQRAKEEKLREMYYNNPPPSNKALLRLTSNTGISDNEEDFVGAQRGGGNVRDYFQQRRDQKQPGNTRKTAHNGYTDMYKQQKRTAGKPPHKPPSAYHGVGRDKSKPLAPISRENSTMSIASTPSRKVSNAYTYDENGKPTPYNKKGRGNSSQKNREQKFSDQQSSPATQDSDTDHSERLYRKEKTVAPSSGQTKTRNFREWQEEQKKKKEILARATMEAQNQEPMSDYQKWQDTMDKDRADRLEKHYQQQQQRPPQETKRATQKAAVLQQQNAKRIEIPVDSDDDEDMSVDSDQLAVAQRQEQELQRQLEKQQRELERIRKKRQQEEEQERLREEADRKRQASLAAKQNKIREQEEEARRREAEQEEKIRRLEAINSNNQKIIAQHSSRPQERPSSNRTYSVNSTKDEPARDESPPSKYFPTKPVRPRSRKASLASAREMEQRNNQYNNNQQQQQNRYDPHPPPKSNRRQPDPYQEEDEEEYVPKQDPASFYLAAAEEAPTEQLQLAECNSCGRKFAQDRLAKHSKVCAAKKKSRKPLDPVAMRTAGTDMAKYAHTAQKEKAKPKPASNWRKKHEDVINTLRYARAAKKAEEDGTALPPPPPSDTSHLVPCPHCNRKFNKDTAERHMPKCKERKEREAMRQPSKAKRR